MTETIYAVPTAIHGTVVATGVSAEDYEKHYAETFHEWVEGTVIRMAPVAEIHDSGTTMFRSVFDFYFAYRPIGRAMSAPFLMRLSSTVRREPDLQVILGDNRANLKSTYMDGPADICIEIVSPGNPATDYVDKLGEYEEFGVREYWLFDPRTKTSLFYRREEEGVFVSQPLPDGIYRTPLLPDFAFPVAMLWQTPVPNVLERMKLVESWFAKQP